MTTTAFLGAYGYGNLGDELCLIEAVQAFPSAAAHAFSVDDAWTRRCVPELAGTFAEGPEMLALRPARIVFGGGMFGVSDAFAAWMPWMAEAADDAAAHLGPCMLAGHASPPAPFLAEQCRARCDVPRRLGQRRLQRLPLQEDAGEHDARGRRAGRGAARRRGAGRGRGAARPGPPQPECADAVARRGIHAPAPLRGAQPGA
jgi:hypothetical protein